MRKNDKFYYDVGVSGQWSVASGQLSVAVPARVVEGSVVSGQLLV